MLSVRSGGGVVCGISETDDIYVMKEKITGHGWDDGRNREQVAELGETDMDETCKGLMGVMTSDNSLRSECGGGGRKHIWQMRLARLTWYQEGRNEKIYGCQEG